MDFLVLNLFQFLLEGLKLKDNCLGVNLTFSNIVLHFNGIFDELRFNITLNFFLFIQYKWEDLDRQFVKVDLKSLKFNGNLVKKRLAFVLCM